MLDAQIQIPLDAVERLELRPRLYSFFQSSLVMSIPEFAKVMGISRGTAYALARRNGLPLKVIKLGRRMVLSRKAVEVLLSGNVEVSHERQ